MVYVTHDQVEAMTLADRIVVLNVGLVEQVGSPLELYQRPRNMFVAGFLGSPKMNFIKSVTEAVNPGKITVRLPGGAQLSVPVRNGSRGIQAGTQVTVGIRPEDVTTPERADAVLSGAVLVVEQLGSESYMYVRTEGDQTVVARRDPTVGARPDQPVKVGLRAAACHVFGSDGLAVERAGPVATA